MRFCFFLVLNILTLTFAYSQNFTGLPLNKILPSDFKFNDTKTVVLVTNKDTLAIWQFDAQASLFTKTMANRSQVLRYYEDSTIYINVDLLNAENRVQQKLVSNKEGNLLYTEVINTNQSPYPYHKTSLFADSTVHFYKNPALKKWKKEVYKNGTLVSTLESTTQTTTQTPNQETLEKHFYPINTNLIKKHQGLFYNPTHFCIYKDKNCVLAETEAKYAITKTLKEQNQITNSYYFVLEQSKISAVYSMLNDYNFQSNVGDFYNVVATSKAYVTNLKDEVRAYTTPKIILFQVDLK